MSKRIKLYNGNQIILEKNPGYCCDIISIDYGCLKDGELIKSLGLYIWDDICFKAYSKNRVINYIDFDIDINHPLYFCVKHLLGNDNELIIDDDDTYGRLNKYLIIKKVNDIYKFIFINNLEKNDYESEKFRVFIKNIGPDCRSKIIDFSIKKRIVCFFRELENILLEDYHQITFEEYLEFNKVKKIIKSRKKDITVGGVILNFDKEYNVYIDESGDEGINKGSKFFILTAIIVEKTKDLEISKSVDLIKENLEMPIKNQLHWKLLKGMPNKNMIMDIISGLDIKIINVIIDTKTIQFIPSNNIYNYFSGYLYERICWYMEEQKGIANINISSRGNLSKKKLQDYLNSNNHKKFNIDTSKIKQIKIIPNERKKLLQLADCCCSALFQALKYNDINHFDYIKKIKQKLYSKNKNLLSYGLKLVPNASKSLELINLINYIKNK